MRKFIWGLLVVVFVGGLVFLGFNSSKTLMTSKVGKITEKQFYEDIKTSSAGQQEFANMVINKVLGAEYGDQVSDTDVQNAYDAQKAQYVHRSRLFWHQTTQLMPNLKRISKII